MAHRDLGKVSLALGLLTVGLTLGVWAYIISRAPSGAFRNQGGMMISFFHFPLTFLGWLIGGAGAIILGHRANWTAGASDGRSAARAGIILGTLGLILSLGTCILPEILAEMLFGPYR